MEVKQINELKPGSHIHLMGVCGTAMASLAGLLKDRGFKVTGSELNPYPPMSTQIENLGITIMKPYKAENLHPKPDFVIVGNVISANNPEAQELMKLGIPYTSLPKAMGEFIIGNRESIVISGTHGKTTTTSLMAWVATEVGVEPGFLIGGIAKNFSKSFQNPKGNFFVIEGDEYDTAYFDKVPKFIHYRPRHVILTSVEFDHADIYADLQAVKNAFSSLMKLIPVNGTLMACAEDPIVMELSQLAKANIKTNVKTYGLTQGDYRATVIKVQDNGSLFNVSYHKNGQKTDLGDYQVCLTGDYNILNTTAVIGLAHSLGWDLAQVKKALATFQGVKRRQEVLGEPGGVLVIEDFAHHPTAVRETIKGIVAKYPGRKLFAVFEPRSATSRRKVFQKDYVEAFKQADQILIAEAFDQGKIDTENRFSSAELAQDLTREAKRAQAYPGADSIVADLVKSSRKGDLILIMSNGGFDGIYTKLISALEARSAEIGTPI
ncbi:MAG: UDP-N-acetylmuramate--L-alanyl-gamma-D-glutamyl-meso-2,6-diaminoheptandioate ligase [Oligoflexia bacterium]|nr:MAG: UDP-N-acetylmuramate--L-alanyl-gamma-D-glutamyl-meso-2,6-diaminoheptandioate ligase [Oligoflexia bacterium]